MDKDPKLFMNELTWNSCNFSMEIQSNDNCFFNPNWVNSMDQSDPFEPALSSIVTSPAASNASVIPPPPPPPPLPHQSAAGDNVMIRELIGRLGNICNSGEISSQSYLQQSHNNSKNTSCYSTPWNSPPKLHLSMMDSHIRGNLPISGLADPGFAERAARLSCFGTRNGLSEIEVSNKLISRPESGKLSRVSSTQSMKVAAGSHQENYKSDGNSGSNKKFNSRLSRSSTPENDELGDSKEESSVSEQISAAQNDVNGRKRKSLPRGKSTTKEKNPPSSSPSTHDIKVVSETEESNSKRSKQDENDGNQKQNKDNSKPPEPQKDYIHVRARRGQATDSHSLAERVRREKISERMKFLQDLVPGCNKVTGKAVMLDEIINYVQSLQRQVEFLSMKLANVNPRMDFKMEAILSKDLYQSRGSVYPITMDLSTQKLFPFGHQEQAGIPLTAETLLFSINNSLNSSLHRNQNLQLPPPSMNGGGYTEAASQVPSLWPDDLLGLVQMGFNPNQPQSFNGGSIATAQTQMKIEM